MQKQLESNDTIFWSSNFYFPVAVMPHILAQIDYFKKDVFKWKVSGAGDGGYIIFWNEHPIENAI